jgi:hypothetical protein
LGIEGADQKKPVVPPAETLAPLTANKSLSHLNPFWPNLLHCVWISAHSFGTTTAIAASGRNKTTVKTQTTQQRRP